MIEIKRATVNEAGLVAKLAIQMWADNSVDGLEAWDLKRQTESYVSLRNYR